MSRVMIEPAGYENCKKAVERAFELFPIYPEGKTVLIKPNVLRASAPEEGITTHPSVLRAVVEVVEAMKPEKLVVGDNPGLFNYGANEQSFRETGLMDVAGKYYENIGNDSVKVDFNPDFMPSVSVSRAVFDADIIISLPRFKTHGLTVMTGAVKNSYGFLPGGQKAVLHKVAGSPERFHDVVVDVFRIRPPDLFIVDAIVGMEGNGPASPDLRDIGKLLASDNAVALDSVIAHMMGLDPKRLRFLQKAKEFGLGEINLENIEILGELETIPDFVVPPLGGEAIINNTGIQDTIKSKTLLRPRPDPELCTACGTCVDQCPVSALTMEEDIPDVDPDTCIVCFCCQEICPEKAIVLA